MSLINFSQDLWQSSNIVYQAGVLSSFGGGVRSQASYTVPTDTKSIIQISMGGSAQLQSGGRTYASKSLALLYFGKAGDVYSFLSETYNSGSAFLIKMQVYKNGSLFFDFQESTPIAGTAWILANGHLQAIEYSA